MPLCCSPRRVQLFTLIISGITIVSVLIILFLFSYPTFARQRVIDSVVFKNGTLEFERFKNTSDLTNLRQTFYLFNVTNADQVVLNSSVKFNLQEIGPFVYHEFKIKEFLKNDQTAGLITYKLKKQWTFLRDQSIGDPRTMKIVWPNVPLIAARTYLDNMSFLERGAAYILLNRAISNMNETAFMTDTVENFLFEGSERKLFEYIQKEDIFKLINPWPLKDNKFGIMYGKNNTWDPAKDHVFTTATGAGVNQTYEDLNQYVYMNGTSTLPYWYNQSSQCNRLRGTDGEFFSPFMNSSKNVEVYSIDICRSLSLKYAQKTYINGIPVYLYKLDESSLQSLAKNKDNACYCLQRDSSADPKPECYIEGLIDLSTCVAPNVVGSGAHFYSGSPELLTRVTGLTGPNVSSHEPRLYVEPNTGLPIQVKVPIQLNVRIEKGGFNIFNFFQDETPLILPLLTVTEAAELTEDQASLLRTKLLLLDSWLVSMVLGGTIVFVTAIIVVGAILCMKFKNKSRQVPRLDIPERQATETDPLITPEEASITVPINSPPTSNYQAI